MSGHICLSFHVVVGAYVLAVQTGLLTILCSPAMSHWRTTTVLLVNSSCITGTPAEDMAAKASWICSAGSNGSASSLRSIRCVRALSRYTPSPDLFSNRSSTAWLASITIITVQLLTDAGLLQVLEVHVFTVNVVAPYTDICTKKLRQISSASIPERLVRVPKQSYIDFGDNFNFGDLVCRRVWLSASWSVGELSSYLKNLPYTVRLQKLGT